MKDLTHNDNTVPSRMHPGWVAASGALDLLTTAPRTWCDPSFAHLHPFGHDTARTLLNLLPKEAMEDRQNSAPTLGNLLTAAEAHPGVTLCGYVVLPPRPDERISIDTLYVPDRYAGEHRMPPDAPTHQGPQGPVLVNDHADTPPTESVWRNVSAALDLVDCEPPDEFTPVAAIPGGGGPGWRAWWD